jgi:hypothetical protein
MEQERVDSLHTSVRNCQFLLVLIVVLLTYKGMIQDIGALIKFVSAHT